MPMATDTKGWTIADLDDLPDDGNTSEVVRGKLLVTPVPTSDHETILARLNDLLVGYVREQRLGCVYASHAVVRHDGSQVEPDLMVRHPPPPKATWDSAPVPVLVIEVHSPSTRKDDLVEKRRGRVLERDRPAMS